MIAHLSYVVCDRCHSNPAQPGGDANEARGIARREGYVHRDGKDLCPTCAALDAQ